MSVWETPAGRAARKLMSPVRAEREAGESELLALRGDAVPALVALLSATPTATEQSAVGRAALLLGALRAREALPALYRAVASGSARGDELASVARALAEILDGRDAFDDAARASLERLASSDDPTTRAFAAEAFGALGDARSRARVQALAQDRDAWVRERASAVLVRWAEQERNAQLADAGSVTVDDFAALVMQAEAQGGALKPWLDDLGDKRRAVRDNAVSELVRAGKSAVPWLIDALHQPNPRARIGAALALGRLQAPEAAAPLLIAATATPTTDEERELRPVALRALANCLTGLEEGLAASILPLARDPDRFVRAAALLCLGRLADRRGMRAVVNAILEDDPFVVESAAVALSEGVREEDVDLVLPLVKALARHPPAAVKEAILIALSRITVDDPALRVRVRHIVKTDVTGPTASMRKAAVVLLERLFHDDDPPPLPVVDAVLGRLADEHPEVRVVAASFLSHHLPPGFSGAVDLLQRAVEREERTVSLLCLEALRRHDTELAHKALEAAAHSRDDVVARRARELLDGFTPRTRPWVFTPKAPPPASAPAVAESQRPRRVRAVTIPPGAVVDAVDPSTRSQGPVAARFDASPPSSGAASPPPATPETTAKETP